jgi:chromosome partitioning protein
MLWYILYCIAYFVYTGDTLKYIILYSTKGGVGKSTLAKLIHTVLSNNNLRKVAGDDTDPQQHYANWMVEHKNNVVNEKDADFFIYDTQGAHTQTNIDLLDAAKDEDALIMIPVRPSNDDLKEAERIAERLSKINILHKCVFVLNGCVANSNYSSYIERLNSYGIKVARKCINSRKAFSDEPKTREINDISALLLEVLV